MGLLVKILLGLGLIALFCVLMDLIAFIYEIAWIFPIIIVGIFLLRLVFRPDFRTKVVSLILGKKEK